MSDVGFALILTLFLTLGMFLLIWVLALKLKDMGIVDIYWGPGFAVIALTHFFLTPDLSIERWVFVITTMTWALRLGLHIGLRHHRSSGEDRRYARMRANGGPSFWWQSFFKIFLLQGALMWLIASPHHSGLIGAHEPPTGILSVIFWFGLIIFTIGFLVESVADMQLRVFKSESRNQGSTMRQGLWAYSRHPNYFGEAVLWWGFGLMGFALNPSLIAFIGPLVITFLLLKVSGVTMLESHIASEKDGYDDYIQTTSAFFPMPPSKQNR